jgi:hypothetical protein
MALVIGLILLFCISSVQSTNVARPFRGRIINNVLTCVTPHQTPGGTILQLEDIKTVPLRPGRIGEPWLPVDLRTTLTDFELSYVNQEILSRHLGSFSGFFLVQPPSPSQPDPSDFRPPNGNTFTTSIPSVLLSGDDTAGFNATVVRAWAESRLGCSLEGRWVALSNNFFPHHIFTGTCAPVSGNTCGLGGEVACHPDLSINPRLESALTWDCCYVHSPFRDPGYTLECGWRRVNIPIVRGCRCGCVPVPR